MRVPQFLIDCSTILVAIRDANSAIARYISYRGPEACLPRVSVSLIERGLTEAERTRFRQLCEAVTMLPFDNREARQFTAVRAQHDGIEGLDAAAAATALTYGLPLMTLTPETFREFSDLRLLRPPNEPWSDLEDWPAAAEAAPEPALLFDGTVIRRVLQGGEAEMRQFPTGHKPAVSVASFAEFDRRTMSDVQRTNFDGMFSGQVEVLDFDAPVSALISKVRGDRVMSPREAVIAATALLHDRTVVTYDVRPFEGVPGLRVRNAATCA